MKTDKSAVCILCKNTTEFEEVAKCLRDSNAHRVLQCKSCHHVQIWPTPNAQEDREFYNENKQPKNLGIKIELEKLRNRQLYDTRRRVKWLTKLIPPGSSVLEVGSSYGFLLEELHKRGYKAEGIEISKERYEISKQVTGAPVLNVDLMRESRLPKHYETVIMTHVLEHINDPVSFCSLLRRYLKKGGSVIAEVPNLDDLMLTSNSHYNSFWWQRAHISYFNKETLRCVFRKAGYNHIKIKGIQRYGIDNMMSWMVSGKPQIDSPTFETHGSYRWMEKYYKSYLEKNEQCDTLIAIAKVHY